MGRKPVEKEHGTRAFYTLGCRCTKCRKANAAYAAENKQLRKQRAAARAAGARACDHSAQKGCADALGVKRRREPRELSSVLSGYCVYESCACCVWPGCTCACHEANRRERPPRGNGHPPEANIANDPAA